MIELARWSLDLLGFTVSTFLLVVGILEAPNETPISNRLKHVEELNEYYLPLILENVKKLKK